MPYSLLHDTCQASVGSVRLARFVAFPLLVLGVLRRRRARRAPRARPSTLGTDRDHRRRVRDHRRGVDDGHRIRRHAEWRGQQGREPRSCAARSRARRRIAGRLSGGRMAVGLHRDAPAVPVRDRRQSTGKRIQRIRASRLRRDRSDSRVFPSDEAFDVVDKLGIRYVILRTGVPNGLTELQAATVASDGVGRYSEAHAQQIIDALPRDRAAAASTGMATPGSLRCADCCGGTETTIASSGRRGCADRGTSSSIGSVSVTGVTASIATGRSATCETSRRARRHPRPRRRGRPLDRGRPRCRRSAHSARTEPTYARSRR